MSSAMTDQDVVVATPTGKDGERSSLGEGSIHAVTPSPTEKSAALPTAPISKKEFQEEMNDLKISFDNQRQQVTASSSPVEHMFETLCNRVMELERKSWSGQNATFETDGLVHRAMDRIDELFTLLSRVQDEQRFVTERQKAMQEQCSQLLEGQKRADAALEAQKDFLMGAVNSAKGEFGKKLEEQAKDLQQQIIEAGSQAAIPSDVSPEEQEKLLRQRLEQKNELKGLTSSVKELTAQVQGIQSALDAKAKIEENVETIRSQLTKHMKETETSLRTLSFNINGVEDGDEEEDDEDDYSLETRSIESSVDVAYEADQRPVQADKANAFLSSVESDPADLLTTKEQAHTDADATIEESASAINPEASEPSANLEQMPSAADNEKSAVALDQQQASPKSVTAVDDGAQAKPSNDGAPIVSGSSTTEESPDKPEAEAAVDRVVETSKSETVVVVGEGLETSLGAPKEVVAVEPVARAAAEPPRNAPTPVSAAPAKKTPGDRPIPKEVTRSPPSRAGVELSIAERRQQALSRTSEERRAKARKRWKRAFLYVERLRQQKRLQFNLSRLRVHKNETVQAKIKRLDDTTHKHDEKLSRLERDLEQKLAKLKNQMEREFDKKLEASLRRIAFAANKGSAPSYAPVASPSKGLALLIDKHQRSSHDMLAVASIPVVQHGKEASAFKMLDSARDIGSASTGVFLHLFHSLQEYNKQLTRTCTLVRSKISEEGQDSAKSELLQRLSSLREQLENVHKEWKGTGMELPEPSRSPSWQVQLQMVTRGIQDLASNAELAELLASIHEPTMSDNAEVDLGLTDSLLALHDHVSHVLVGAEVRGSRTAASRLSAQIGAAAGEDQLNDIRDQQAAQAMEQRSLHNVLDNMDELIKTELPKFWNDLEKTKKLVKDLEGGGELLVELRHEMEEKFQELQDYHDELSKLEKHSVELKSLLSTKAAREDIEAVEASIRDLKETMEEINSADTSDRKLMDSLASRLRQLQNKLKKDIKGLADSLGGGSDPGDWAGTTRCLSCSRPLSPGVSILSGGGSGGGGGGEDDDDSTINSTVTMQTSLSAPPRPNSRAAVASRSTSRPGTGGAMSRIARGPAPLGAAKMMRSPAGRMADPHSGLSVKSRTRSENSKKPLHELFNDYAESASPTTRSSDNGAWLSVGNQVSPTRQLDPIRFPRNGKPRVAATGPYRGSAFRNSATHKNSN
jgi:hypothetical protein